MILHAKIVIFNVKTIVLAPHKMKKAPHPFGGSLLYQQENAIWLNHFPAGIRLKIKSYFLIILVLYTFSSVSTLTMYRPGVSSETSTEFPEGISLLVLWPETL